MKIADPRQAIARDNYINPKSETFANLKQSMIRAGYSDTYADTIAGRNPTWLTDNMEADIKLITQAEKNLRRYTEMTVDKLEKKNDIEKAKLQIDVSKFIVKTLARKKYGEQEEDDKGKNVQVNIINYSDKKIEAHEVEAKEV